MSNPMASEPAPLPEGGAASASSAAPVAPRPSPSATSSDEYMALITHQHGQAVSLISRITLLTGSNADIVVDVDCVLYMYVCGADGTIRRFPIEALASGAAVKAKVVTAHEVDVQLGENVPTAGRPVTSVVQHPQTKKAKDLESEWAVPEECVCTELDDVFNDKLNYKFTCVEDAQRLVPAMLKLAKKYHSIAREGPAREALHVLWGNYDAIVNTLEYWMEILTDAEPDVDLDAAAAEVDAVNASMDALATAGVMMATRAPTFLSVCSDAGIPTNVATSAVSLLSAHLTARGLAASTGMKLLYSGARDGLTPTAYHLRVDGQPRLLTHICGDGFWFGAYTNAAPSSTNNHWTSDPHACLMTITNPHGIAPTVYPVRAEEAKKAICTRTDSGPRFGGGHDLVLRGPDFESNNDFNFPTSYVDSTGKGCLTFTGKKEGWRVTAIIVVQV